MSNSLRVYDPLYLKSLSHSELKEKLDMVKCNDDLTIEEKEKNIDVLNFAITGFVNHTRDDVLRDIEMSSADIDDIDF